MHEVVKQIVDSVPEFGAARKEVIELRSDEPIVIMSELIEFGLDEYRAGNTQRNSAFLKVLVLLESFFESDDDSRNMLAHIAALHLLHGLSQEYRNLFNLASRERPKLAQFLKKIVTEDSITAQVKGVDTLRRLRAYVPEFEDFAKAENSEDWELPTVMFACLVRFIVEQYRQGRTSSESPFSRTLEFLEDIARSNDKYAVNLVWTGFLESLHVAGPDYEGIVARFGKRLRRLLRRVVL
jgi:hypothetical protein